MVYGQDALAQIWQQTQLQHNALSDGSQNIDIHKETTGQSITKLNAQNQRLGDAIDDIQGNIAGEATVISNTHGGNTNRANTIGTEGVSANLLNADDDVSLLFEDVQLRKDDYGEKGNNIYDFLDALGESEEDFDLLEFFTNEDTFENAYEMYGKGDVDFEDFVKFDFGKFDDDLGFEIDFDDKDNTLTLYFPDADTGYRYGDDEEDGNHSNTNSAASSSNGGPGNASETGRINRTRGNGKNKGCYKKNVKYSSSFKGSNKKIDKIFNKIFEKVSDVESDIGKSIFSSFKNMFDAGENMKIGKLFSSEKKFDVASDDSAVVEEWEYVGEEVEGNSEGDQGSHVEHRHGNGHHEGHRHHTGMRVKRMDII